MIKLVCPACKQSSDRAQTKLVIEAIGFTRIVPSRERGVERAVAAPIHIMESHTNINISPESTLICSKCEKESSIKMWKYMVICDHCGSLITPKPIKDPAATSDEYICRDTMSLYCNRCWERSTSREYCPGCRYRENCSTYNNR